MASNAADMDVDQALTFADGDDDVLSSLMKAGISIDEIYMNVSTRTNPLDRGRVSGAEGTRGRLEDMILEDFAAGRNRSGAPPADTGWARDEDDVLIPCEYCNKLTERDLYMLHVTKCAHDLPTKSNEEEVEVEEMLTCERCSELFSHVELRRHERQCGLRNDAPGEAMVDGEITCRHCSEAYPVVLYYEHEMNCDRRPKVQEEKRTTEVFRQLEDEATAPVVKKPKIIYSVPKHDVETKTGSLLNSKNFLVKTFGSNSDPMVTELEPSSGCEQNYSKAEMRILKSAMAAKPDESDMEISDTQTTCGGRLTDADVNKHLPDIEKKRAQHVHVFTIKDSSINWNRINREADRQHGIEEKRKRKYAHQKLIGDLMLQSERKTASPSSPFSKESKTAFANLGINLVKSLDELEFPQSKTKDLEQRHQQEHESDGLEEMEK